jgi:UTP--glucose-1-phosphate uridylyltransferase
MHLICFSGSDYFVLNDDDTITRNPARTRAAIDIDLDNRFYAHLDQLKQRFPAGAPSLVECEALSIRGDVSFGKDVTVRGKVGIYNHTDQGVSIAAGTVLQDDVYAFGEESGGKR